MTRDRLVNVEREAVKRQLRAETARLRGQIDDRLRDVSAEAKRLTQWQTYVERNPQLAMGMAFGVGWWLAGSKHRQPGPNRLMKRVAATIITSLGSAAASTAWRELLATLSGAFAASRK